MGLIREPKGVDFFIQGNTLTETQENEISAFIAKRKLEIKQLANKKKKTKQSA